MEAVYNWVKNIVIFYILLTAVLHLLPKNSYQKYVRFFGGLLLVVLLLTPLMELIFKEDYLLNEISYESFWQEVDTIRLDVEGMEEKQQQAYRREYEKAIGADISLMAQEAGLVVHEVTVEITEDYGPLNIVMDVSLSGEEGIFVEKMTRKDNSSDYPAVANLKEKIMDFYHVTDEEMEIRVREGG